MGTQGSLSSLLRSLAVPQKKIVKFPSKISRRCWGLKNRNYGYDGKSELLYLTPLWTFSDEVFAVMVVVFVRSGNVNLPGVSGATFRNAGINGYDWSSRASSTRNDGAAIPSAYNLEFNASTVNPSNGPNERWHGFPLRCPFECHGGVPIFK